MSTGGVEKASELTIPSMGYGHARTIEESEYEPDFI